MTGKRKAPSSDQRKDTLFNEKKPSEKRRASSSESDQHKEIFEKLDNLLDGIFEKSRESSARYQAFLKKVRTPLENFVNMPLEQCLFLKNLKTIAQLTFQI